MIVLRIALRNLRLHWVRSLIVGGLICLGTVLVIVTNSVLDAVEAGMQRSIVDSVAGHLQVYSKDARDDLALFGSPGVAQEDIGKIPSFKEARDKLLENDNVEAVIPMGGNTSIAFAGNAFDIKLRALREAVKVKDSERIAGLKEHLQRMVKVLNEDLPNLRKIASDDAIPPEYAAAAKRAETDAFWADFDKDPLATLEILENKIAPLGTRTGIVFLRYIGTDPQAFAKTFELFEIVDGEMIPEGQRGFLFNKRVYERRVKNRVAYQLDNIKRARDEEGRLIASDEELQTWVERNAKQYRSIVYDLEPGDIPHVTKVLQEELGKPEEQDVTKLLPDFFTMDDDNFDRRHKLFYDEIAPRIILYKYKVGDDLTLTSYTRAGYPRSVNVKIWGTFRFRSLERSTLAGANHLVDMITFRELYGFPTEAQKEEMKEIDKAAGVREVARENAEDALFGEGATLVEEQTGDGFDEFAEADLKGRRAEAIAQQRKPYSQRELEEGMALNMAVFLKDPDKLEETKTELAGLEAGGTELQAVSWHEASGIVGQFTATIRIVMFVLILAIFLAAMAIIVVSMVMATLARVREIGTMRAIGAQRRFVMNLFIAEPVLLSFMAGTIGAIIGGSIVLALNSAGIPAFHDILFFLFGGPSLHPELTVKHLWDAFSLVMFVATIATLLPAILAARVRPVVAMEAKE